MEFYKIADQIRFEIDLFIERDYGVNHRVHNVKVFYKKMSDYDKNRIYEILDPYDVADGKVFGVTISDDFYDTTRTKLRNLAWDLMECIIDANEVYVYCDSEYERRRCLQGDAVTCCHKIYAQLQHIKKFVDIDLNKAVEIFELLDKEIDLLQGWKKANHEAWKKLRGETVNATNACNANGNNGNANNNNASNRNFVRPRFNGSK